MMAGADGVEEDDAIESCREGRVVVSVVVEDQAILRFVGDLGAGGSRGELLRRQQRRTTAAAAR